MNCSKAIHSPRKVLVHHFSDVAVDLVGPLIFHEELSLVGGLNPSEKYESQLG